MRLMPQRGVLHPLVARRRRRQIKSGRGALSVIQKSGDPLAPGAGWTTPGYKSLDTQFTLVAATRERGVFFLRACLLMSYRTLVHDFRAGALKQRPCLRSDKEGVFELETTGI